MRVGLCPITIQTYLSFFFPVTCRQFEYTEEHKNKIKSYFLKNKKDAIESFNDQTQIISAGPSHRVSFQIPSKEA